MRTCLYKTTHSIVTGSLSSLLPIFPLLPTTRSPHSPLTTASSPAQAPCNCSNSRSRACTAPTTYSHETDSTWGGNSRRSRRKCRTPRGGRCSAWKRMIFGRGTGRLDCADKVRSEEIGLWNLTRLGLILTEPHFIHFPPAGQSISSVVGDGPRAVPQL